MITKLLYSKTAQKSLILLTFFIFSISAFSQNEFITTWKTDNPGTSNDSSITIPTTGAGYNYDVDWDNDGTFDEFGITGNVTHDFTSAGTYTIRIQGAFPRIYFISGIDEKKIISIDQWGTIAWASMASAFRRASNLVGNATDAPDLSGVTDMSWMFAETTMFNQDISSWDTSTITNMSLMFYKATAFNNGGQPFNWNTGEVTNMGDMFNGASVFNQNIGSWNTAKVTNMSTMFRDATVFNQNIGGWNTALVTNMSNMFQSAIAFNQNIGSWDTSNVVFMTFMFGTATAFNQDIGGWDTSMLERINATFSGATSFNNGGQPLNWNTSKVTEMDHMFNTATSFNQDISSWNTSLVYTMNSMFTDASTFNQNIGGWNTTTVQNMYHMFNGASAFNQDISLWNTSIVSTMSNMFNAATAFNNGGQPLNWNTSSVGSMENMFKDAITFNQDIGGWDVSAINISNMRSMFYNATAFNQDIGNWDMAGITDLSNMFNNAIAFDQDLGSWNVESVTSFFDMFNGATLSDANYDALLIGWDAQNLQSSRTFNGGNSQYCSPAGQAARAHMVDFVASGGDGWTITDGGLFSGTCGQLGLEDIELNSILLYPNPTKGNVTISLNSSASYSLVSLLGQEIQKGTFTFGDNTLDISNLSKGLYVLNVKTSQGTTTKKIIKQ